MVKKRKVKKKIIGFPALVGTVFIIFCFAVLLWWSGSFKAVSNSTDKYYFEIKQGSTAATIAAELEDRNLIRESLVFRYLCKASQADSKLAAGDYYISPSMKPEEIVQLFLKGPAPNIVRVTIPEGYTVKDIVELLEANGLGTKKSFYAAMDTFDKDDYSFLKDVPQGDNRLEGFLFPDTYFFDINVGCHATIDRLLQRFSAELTDETRERLNVLGMSVSEWVIKASIVEKEAAKDDERAVIAGVFENRLKIDMPLQSCATVQYLLDEVKPVLSYADEKIESPYNTYKYAGLPPGPIANPGHASLQAALYPEKNNYYYFVAKSDGSHAFANSYDEHLRNISIYQK